MATFDIPADLLNMLAERRVIPFLGAGFSAGLGLASWDKTLQLLCEETEEKVDYNLLKSSCNNDLLQVAEYLFLKADKNIGPIRHILSTQLQPKEHPIFSAAHVELVNLGAPQVYTTNYDECIERTYRELEQPVEVVALPKHIALLNSRKTQVVKYHGDLRFDSTLVLTESSYYTRLDFESPMDLKFRSDLLGRSVLFMGYSFRDINIRIIWFKLMQMMKDIPSTDRPISFIVRFEKNPFLETLYESVGLKTIVLDPKGDAKTDAERTRVLGQFMLDLSMRSNSIAKAVPPRPTFISTALTDAIAVAGAAGTKASRFFLNRLDSRVGSLLNALNERVIIKELQPNYLKMLQAINRSEISEGIVIAAKRYLRQASSDPAVTYILARGLCREYTRSPLLDDANLRWPAVWNQALSQQEIKILLGILDTEIDHHTSGTMDDDLAYAIDIAHRILNKTMGGADDEQLLQAKSLIARASELYPAARDYVPPTDGVPEVADIISQIADRMESEAVDDDSSSSVS